jgi:hypothetical protein
VAVLFAAAWMAACPSAVAEESPEAVASPAAFAVEEVIDLEVDAVGDVRHENVLAYEREVFDAQRGAFEEYPFLLFRRYRALEDVDEIQGFRSVLDEDAATVTLTFEEAGRAYNMGDRWMMYGLSGRPESFDGHTVLIEDESVENSDFTLWEDLAFKTTTRVTLPEGTQHVRWDDAEAALVWETPEQRVAFTAGESLLGRHRTAFVALFAALMAGSAAAGLAVVLRGRRATG